MTAVTELMLRAQPEDKLITHICKEEGGLSVQEPRFHPHPSDPWLVLGLAGPLWEFIGYLTLARL